MAKQGIIRNPICFFAEHCWPSVVPSDATELLRWGLEESVADVTGDAWIPHLWSGINLQPSSIIQRESRNRTMIDYVTKNGKFCVLRPGSYVVYMAYNFLYPAGKVSKLPRKLCRLRLSKVSGARAAQTCASGGGKVSKSMNFHPGKVPIKNLMKDMEAHWIQRDQLPEFAPTTSAMHERPRCDTR